MPTAQRCSTRSTGASTQIDRERASTRRARRPGRRHDLPVHRRSGPRRPDDGCVADPVERVRVREPPRRTEHRDQPPQPRDGLQPGGRPSRPSSGPAVGRPTRCRRRSPPGAISSLRCSARWAATPSRRSCCRSQRGCSTTASRRRPRDRRRPVDIAGPGHRLRHLDRRRRAPRGPSRAMHRATGSMRSPPEATAPSRTAAWDSGFGHAHAIVVETTGARRRCRPENDRRQLLRRLTSSRIAVRRQDRSQPQDRGARRRGDRVADAAHDSSGRTSSAKRAICSSAFLYGSPMQVREQREVLEAEQVAAGTAPPRRPSRGARPGSSCSRSTRRASGSDRAGDGLPSGPM